MSPTTPAVATSRRRLAPLFAVLLAFALLAACGDDDDGGVSGDDGVRETTDDTATTTPETSSDSEANADVDAATDAPTGPQICGEVTSTIGDPLTVAISTGDDLGCSFAETLLDTYYNDPPQAPEGSGAFVTIDGWTCNSSSSLPEGISTRCTNEAGDEIVSFPPTSFDTDEPVGGSTDDSESACALIDAPTLAQLFPDGNQDEGVCQAYIGGENAIDSEG